MKSAPIRFAAATLPSGRTGTSPSDSTTRSCSAEGCFQYSPQPEGHGSSTVRRTPCCGCSHDRTPAPSQRGQSSLRNLAESSTVPTGVLPVGGEPGSEAARAVHHVEVHRASSPHVHGSEQDHIRVIGAPVRPESHNPPFASADWPVRQAANHSFAAAIPSTVIWCPPLCQCSVTSQPRSRSAAASS